MFKNLKYILTITFVLMLAHTVEEYVTQVWNFDPFMTFVSRYFGIGGAGIYAVIQILALTLILVFLIRISQNKFDTPLAVLMGFVFILELLHPYNSILIWGYYPGLYTGMGLVIAGFFYAWELSALLLRRQRL